MPKRKKRASVSSPPETKSVSHNRPRLDSQERLLSRFHEPLVLLYTLGRTRGERTSVAVPAREHLAHLPLNDMRRIFLNELAYVCDYDKGGETVTALGLQCTPQGHIFWVASNAGLKTKVVEFLDSLLNRLLHTGTATDVAQLVAEVASDCITFAAPRIKKYKSHLKPLLRRCTSHLEAQEAVENGFLEWLQDWAHAKSCLETCRAAYADRKSDFMRTLARLSAEPSYKSGRGAIHTAFGMIRHYIGRLGHHFRAAEVLVSCAPRLASSLYDFEVREIPILDRSAMPSPDGLTTADKILVRMLPAGSPDLAHYQQAFADMESRYQLFRRFRENYAQPDRNGCVHAEVQVLEHFYANEMQYAGDDPYIACSKPACFCCRLYFRHHPGHVAEPSSHNKIYLNWRSPKFSTPTGRIGPNHQRDILNGMNQEIRKEALRQIDEKSASIPWRPDSITGITQSTPYEQARGSVDSHGVVSSVGDYPTMCGRVHDESADVGTTDTSLFEASTEEEGEIEGRQYVSSEHTTTDITELLESILERSVGDFDKSGGNQL